LLCFLLVGTTVRAQDWNSVLDRYEIITAKCKDLRDKAAAGENVSGDSVTKLLGELNRLRNELGQASGKMTKSQRERFKRIRESYDGPGKTVVVKSNTVRRKEPDPEIVEIEEKPREVIAPLPLSRAPAKDILAEIDDKGSIIRPGIAAEKPNLIEKAPGRMNIVALTSFGDSQNYGAFVSYSPGKWGGYVSARSNLKSSSYMYDCYSDGSLEGGGLFWGDGSSMISELCFTAGVVYGPIKNVDIFTGLGYGSSTLCWRDISGDWSRVVDASGSGLEIECGAVFHIGIIRLLGGVSWLTARPEYSAFKPVFSVGLGIGF